MKQTAPSIIERHGGNLRQVQIQKGYLGEKNWKYDNLRNKWTKNDKSVSNLLIIFMYFGFVYESSNLIFEQEVKRGTKILKLSSTISTKFWNSRVQSAQTRRIIWYYKRLYFRTKFAVISRGEGSSVHSINFWNLFPVALLLT